MQPASAKNKKEWARKRRHAAERWQRHLEQLRLRRDQADRDRKKRLRWLIMMWLTILESVSTRSFFPIHFADADLPVQKRQSKPPRKSEEQSEAADTRTDDERRYLYDYATRHGEEHLEVYDGLTYADIVAYNRVHRPWLFPKFVPIPGMPSRYADEPVHIWTLLNHIGSEYHRKNAITALKLVVSSEAHDWIEACAATDEGWKDLPKCRRRTPEMTIYEFPRAAARWREEQRREAEERKREFKEAPDNAPKPSGLN